MSCISCINCAQRFDAASNPCCPRCLVEAWLATEGFIRPKHDSNALPLVWDRYRSVLIPALVAKPKPHLEYAAQHGTWYHDTYYDMYVHFTPEPLGMAPGAGIPAGCSTPAHALDSLLIAEADSAVGAHVFAVDRERHEAQVRAGEFAPLECCETPLCDNLQVPGRARCSCHLDA